MNIIRRIAFVVAISLTTALTACAGGGAADRTAGQTMDDATLTGRVKSALIKDPVVKAMDINVDSYRGVVQLTGFVDNEEQSERAEEIARSFEVRDVKNQLIVKD